MVLYAHGLGAITSPHLSLTPSPYYGRTSNPLSARGEGEENGEGLAPLSAGYSL
jgi:hypothetical protein